jgi:hypothetical protein
MLNKYVKELSKENIKETILIRHALKLGLGDKSFDIDYYKVPTYFINQLNNLVNFRE